MPNDKPPWYAAGLQFECKEDCGACCTNHDEYAYVYLVGDDVDRLVAHLRIDEDDFFTRYTELDDGYLVLRMDSPDCRFSMERDVRPTRRGRRSAAPSRSGTRHCGIGAAGSV